MKDVKYYKSFDEDIIYSSNQNYILNSNYKWIHKNVFYKFLSYILYYIFLLVSLIYSKMFLHVKYKNKKILKGSYFLYSNHTLQYGDVFNPLITCFPKRPYIVCSPSNLGIPVIGKLLPILGALPIPNNIHDMKKFKDAVIYYNKKHPIVIYPESHLWPWCTFIRDFNKSAFHFPAEVNSKVFTSTTVFNKKSVDIYLDEIINKNSDSKKDLINSLCNEAYETMKKRSKLNTYKKIEYKKQS